MCNLNEVPLYMEREAIECMFEAYGVLLVEFTKTNGEDRSMVCTTLANLIPDELLIKSRDSSRAVNHDVMTVYDVEAKGWRSFRLDSVWNVLGDKELTEEYVHGF